MTRQRRYHHGNLKPVLLKAGLKLISEVGPQGFTLREVARRAGVSHNAPYRHFHDREDLLWAVAAQGFDLLAASLQRAMDKGRSARERFLLCGRAYVQFALRRPQHIQVMFDRHAGHKPPAAAAVAGRRAFQILLDAVAALQAEGALPAGDPHRFAVVAWSGVHGFAKLALNGHLPFTRKQAIGFTSYLTRTLAAGLAGQPQH